MRPGGEPHSGRRPGRGSELAASVSRGTGRAVLSISTCRWPPGASRGVIISRSGAPSFQSHDSVASFRPGRDLIILEIISLARPTWGKANYLDWEPLASRPASRSQTGTLSFCFQPGLACPRESAWVRGEPACEGPLPQPGLSCGAAVEPSHLPEMEKSQAPQQKMSGVSPASHFRGFSPSGRTQGLGGLLIHDWGAF